VAGHSFGGQTALSLVAQCCRASRVDAALVLAGVTDASDGPALHNVRGPVLFVHARNDRAVPYGPTLDTCAIVEGWKRMLTVEEIRGPRAHIEPYLGDGEYADVVQPATVDFLDGRLRDDAAARRRLSRAGAGTGLAGLSRCRPGATDGR
jgi:dienelactone hydrolase